MASRRFVVCLLLAALFALSVSANTWSDANQMPTDADGNINLDSDNLVCWVRTKSLDVANRPDSWRVDEWADESGKDNANNGCGKFTATADARPFYKKHILNGHGVVRFDQVAATSAVLTQDDSNFANYKTAVALKAAGTQTYFIVARHIQGHNDGSDNNFMTVGSGVGTHFDLGSKATTQAAKIEVPHSTGTEFVETVSADVNSVQPLGRGNRFHVYAVSIATNSYKVYIDGTSDTPWTAGGSSDDAAISGTADQDEATATQVLGGGHVDVAEFLAFSKTLTVAEIDRVAWYLAKKFSLPWVVSYGSLATGYVSSRDGVLGTRSTHTIKVKVSDESTSATTATRNGVSNTASDAPIISGNVHGVGDAGREDGAGAWLTIYGKHVLPNDPPCATSPCVGAELNTWTKFLKITVGNLPRACADPTSTETCERETYVMEDSNGRAFTAIEYPAENTNHPTGVCYYLHTDGAAGCTGDACKAYLPQHGQYIILSSMPRNLWKVDRRVPYNANAYAHSDFSRLICAADGTPVTVPGINAGDSTTWKKSIAGTWSYSTRTEKECTLAKTAVWAIEGQDIDPESSGNDPRDIIKCRLPQGAGFENNINIYWGGVPTVLRNWFHYDAPEITGLSPASASYTGGAVITVYGRNFGSSDDWRHYSAGDSMTVNSRASKRNLAVEVSTRSPQACSAVQYVDAGTLTCTLPALPLTVQTVDKTSRTVAGNVAVVIKGTRSRDGGGASFSYSAVPAYYSCANTDDSSSGKNTCFTCCRHECVVDEFALGGKRGGQTYSHCDRECYRYCGYLSRRRTAVRRLLWARAKGRAALRRLLL